MTIQEAQEYSREHGLTACRTDNNIKIDKSCYDAIAEIEYALNNGYQLCKVDKMINTIKNKSTMMADCNYPLGDSMEYGLYVKDIEEIIEEACK